ncbi:MAG TPA: outer membrane beta-barrel protein, partial [Chitinophagaceae bacterium]|nr:outer membrane beta-barrel protein [Chitinophagaceae bacterium]
MKKAIYIILFFLLTGKLNAQVEWGIFAGPQITAARYTILNEKQKQDPKYGFHAGVSLKIPFENKLFFSPEVFYSWKGYKVTFTQFVYPPGPKAKNNNT